MAHTLRTIMGIAALAVLGLLAALLVGQFLNIGPGYEMRIVSSGSMAPTIPMGSVVFVSPRTTYTEGDVVMYARRGDRGATTHRVVDVSEEGYTMRGDANNANDPKLVAQSEILGRVWLSVPYLGFILDFIRRPIGLVLVVGLPLLFLAYERMSGKKATVETAPPQSV